MVAKKYAYKGVGWKSIGRSIIRLLIIISVISVAASVSLVFAGQVNDIQLPNKLQDFSTLASSIMVEAVPFIILGALVAGFVQTFVSEKALFKILPKSPFFRRIVLSLSGSIFPVCECGNVPVARSLLAKGVKPAEAVTFLLAAPILNPVTFITTMEAFRFDQSMVVIRMVGAFIIANFIGWVLHHHPNQKSLVVDDFKTPVEVEHKHKHSLGYKKNKLTSMFVTEFWTMFKMLSVGAFVAAATQSFIPREVLLHVGSQPVLSVLAMLLLAFIISLCANVDAFFALAYSSTFTFGSLAAFLIFGPMIDIKILLLMKTTFTTRLLIIITTLCFLMSLLIGLLVNYAL